MTSTVVLTVGLESSFFRGQSLAWQSAGYSITSAWSIREAINLLHDIDFDIVLLGHSLTFESRERLAFLIRASGSRVPVACLENPSGDCDSFADATLKCEYIELIAGIGELLARRARTSAVATSAQLRD